MSTINRVRHWKHYVRHVTRMFRDNSEPCCQTPSTRRLCSRRTTTFRGGGEHSSARCGETRPGVDWCEVVLRHSDRDRLGATRMRSPPLIVLVRERASSACVVCQQRELRAKLCWVSWERILSD